MGNQLFLAYRLDIEIVFPHEKCNTNPIISDLDVFGLCCLQGLHSLDSANQVEVFTEPSVCPQASDATTGVKDKAGFLFLAASLS